MGEATPDKPFGFYDATVGGGWEVPGEPYTNTAENPQRTVPLVAAADARRTDQPLGADRTSQRAL